MRARIINILSGLVLGMGIGHSFVHSAEVNEIQSIDRSMMKIKAGLLAVDRNIAQENDSYLRQTQKMQELEEQIHQLDESLQEKEKWTQQRSRQVKKQFLALSLLTGRAAKEVRPGQLVEKKILLQQLKKDLLSLASGKQTLDERRQQLTSLQSDYEESKKSQNQIYQTILKLQARKEDFGKSLNHVQRQQSVAQAQLIKAQVKQSLGPAPAAAARDAIFGIPVQQFKQIKMEDPGVSFMIDQSVPILAPGDGKVVYIGELSSYGQVVMIDHGSDLRTLILGNLKLNVQRNLQVKEGDVLGYAQTKVGHNKVYFEVRKREVPEAPMKYLKI